jgi:hypothetical protein
MLARFIAEIIIIAIRNRPNNFRAVTHYAILFQLDDCLARKHFQYRARITF